MAGVAGEPSAPRAPEVDDAVHVLAAGDVDGAVGPHGPPVTAGAARELRGRAAEAAASRGTRAGLRRRPGEVRLLGVGPDRLGGEPALDRRVRPVAVDAGAPVLGGGEGGGGPAGGGERAAGRGAGRARWPGSSTEVGHAVALRARDGLPDGSVPQVEAVRAHGRLGGRGLAREAGRGRRAVAAPVAGGAERAVASGDRARVAAGGYEQGKRERAAWRPRLGARGRMSAAPRSGSLIGVTSPGCPPERGR